MSTENKLSQKEYLKRYLSNDKDDKKKKKRKIVSSSTVLKRSQIIDDDIDLKNMRALNDDEVELYQLDEDAPQVAGIIDERPPEVQAMEYYGNKKRWRVFGADSGDGDELIIKDSFDNAKEVLGKDKSLILSDLNKSKFSRDQSVNKNGDSDLELPRKQRKQEYNSDNSSFHKVNKETSSKRESRQSESDSDESPPRFSRSKNKQKSKSNRNDDSDLSPPRTNSLKKKYKSNDSDISPPRKSNKSSERKFEDDNSGSDLSPPRRTKSSARKSYRKNSDSDLSPPRRPDKHEQKSKHFKDSDFSPPRRDRSHLNSRKYKNGSDSDLSPPRRDHEGGKNIFNRRSDEDKYNLHGRDSDRYYKNNKGPSQISNYKKDRRKYENSRISEDDRRGNDSKSNKMTKTLEGKQAGLQNAKQLKKELSEFKEREDKLFSKLSSDLSGRGAAPVMRDRKTGQKRDLVKERSDALEKAEKSAAQNEKYSRWGRGLKQVEDAAEKVASAIHEMSKPLARYADDDDLDKLLKAQEREGDPMLDYIRQKQSEAIPLTESKPVYKGTFLPNRFGIRPGYRWDGVDRSNGYEKQWFTTQNNRKARDEEAYKWSTSDM